MKVEIWSDVVCPFCYIGKRKFEKALGEFAHRDDVQIEWKSFQLTPDFVPTAGESIHLSLAKKKGVPEAEGRRMNDYMTQAAKEVGLNYQFDIAIPANTFQAHQLIHFAAHQGQQGAMKERLFAAYYLEGRDLNELDTLLNLAAEIGLDTEAARQALEAGTYANEVRRDEYEAQQIGVRGVPFFVFEDKYAVSGAQPSEVFVEVLGKVWDESHPAKVLPTMLADGPACGPDGCD
jgi:predicted DsbA family dithiol-disulfide isomerase